MKCLAFLIFAIDAGAGYVSTEQHKVHRTSKSHALAGILPPISIRYEPPSKQQEGNQVASEVTSQKIQPKTITTIHSDYGYKLEWEFMTAEDVDRLRWKPRWGYYLVPPEEAKLRPFFLHENPAAAFATDLLDSISFFARGVFGAVYLYSAHILGFDVDKLRPPPSVKRAAWKRRQADPEEEIRRAMRREAGVPDPRAVPGPLERAREALCRLRGGGGDGGACAGIQPGDGGAATAWRMPPAPQLPPDRLRGMEGGSWKDGRFAHPPRSLRSPLPAPTPAGARMTARPRGCCTIGHPAVPCLPRAGRAPPGAPPRPSAAAGFAGHPAAGLRRRRQVRPARPGRRVALLPRRLGLPAGRVPPQLPRHRPRAPPGPGGGGGGGGGRGAEPGYADAARAYVRCACARVVWCVRARVLCGVCVRASARCGPSCRRRCGPRPNDAHAPGGGRG